MIPFAFYGRVSTEDQQDPESSRSWQLHRSRQLIESHGGVVVAEYFDIGQSRSLPWKRRPEATRLLDDFRSANRQFAAVVIGEPQRAFYGNQFGLTFPVFTHFGIGLWVPEVGGAVDPGSEAHDLVMTLFGGMSKGERMRIKTRVRSAMTAQTATEGRFLGGRPPYGYQLVNLGPHPKADKAALGISLRGLEPDPETAPHVVRIFEDFLDGHGYYAIAERLNADDVPSPSGHDRKRNAHRHGNAWGKSAVRAILMNPRYTGYQVWNKQRRDEILMDIDDVAAGHHTVQRWNATDDWVWSREPAHTAIVPQETFDRAQAIIASKTRTKTSRKQRPTPRNYALNGRLICGLCDRRLQGSWNHDTAYYRCSYAREYAASRKIDHPKTVYLRESDFLGQLDSWLTQVFEADNLAALGRQIVQAESSRDDKLVEIGRLEKARAECLNKITRYREALETGTETSLVMSWISETTASLALVESELHELKARPPEALTEESVMGTLNELGGLAGLLTSGDPGQRADFYEALGLNAVYNPTERTVDVTLNTRVRTVRVGEPTLPDCLQLLCAVSCS